MGAKQKPETKKELAAKQRIEEFDRLFKRIYKGSANGQLALRGYFPHLC